MHSKWSKKHLILLFIVIALAIVLLFNMRENPSRKNPTGKIQNNNLHDKPYEINLSEIAFNKYVSNYPNGQYSIDRSYLHGNIYYGEILDVTKNGNLLLTKSLFSYNLVNEEFKIYEFNLNKRIWQYFIKDNYIYYIILTGSEESYFTWELFRSDINFNNPISIKKGNTINPLYAAWFVRGSNDELLFISINNNLVMNEMSFYQVKDKEFNIYEVEGLELKVLKNGTGNACTREGLFLCDMFNYYLDNNKLVYCQITDYKKQEIISLDIKSLKEEILYLNNTDKLNINNFILFNDGIYVNMNTPTNATAKETIKFLNFETAVERDLNNSLSIQTQGKVLENKVLAKTSTGWTMFDMNENIQFDVYFPDIYVYPFFTVIGDNKIILKSENQKYYIGTLNKK